MPKFVDDLNVAGALTAHADASKTTQTVQAATGQTQPLTKFLAADGTTVVASVSVAGVVDATSFTVAGTALKTALALVKGDVGLGNVDNTSDANKPVSTAQQTAIDAKALKLTTTSKTTTYSAVDGDFVLADASGGAFTVTLPTPTAGRRVAVKKTDSSANAVTVATASGNIDGSSTRTLAAQYQAQHYAADGTNWQRESVPAVSTIAASGTPSSTTYLRGDGTWATPSATATPMVPPAFLDSGVYAPLNPGTSISTGQHSNNTLNGWQCVPFCVSKTVTMSKISVQVTTAGSAGAVLRVGIYADSGGRPGALISDLGTQLVDSTGTKDWTYTGTFTAGVQYWLITVNQTAVGASFNIHTPQAQMGRATGSTVAGFSLVGYDSGNTGGTGSISGALPDPLNVGTTVNGGTSQCIRVMGKV